MCVVAKLMSAVLQKKEGCRCRTVIESGNAILILSDTSYQSDKISMKRGSVRRSCHQRRILILGAPSPLSWASERNSWSLIIPSSAPSAASQW